MALDKTILGNLIKSKLTAIGRDVSKIDTDGLTAIADAIVTHITTSAVVTTADITTCGAGAGTGTGSGTVS